MTPLQVAAGVTVVAAFLGGALLGRQAVKADWAAEREQQDRAQVQAIESARADERKLSDAVDESASRARDEIVQLRIARAGADAESVRLRQRIAAIVAAGRAAPAWGGDAAGDPIGVLGRVLAESDALAGEYAAAADASRTAGIACQRSYEALSRR